MNRLPSYDALTSLTEHCFFLGLGLAAAVLIAITASDAARFSNSRQEIITELTDPGTALAENGTNVALTNLRIVHTGRPDERARVDGVSKPKS